MGIINYAAPNSLLTIARGHPYDREAFASLFAGLDDYDVCHVEQPLAQRMLTADTAREFRAIVCYDMPGVDFTGGDGEARLVQPDEALTRDFCAMLEAGIGVVFMHHALAAWPAWPDYAEIIGGRFHYRPAQLRGLSWPDSGYRHKVTHRVKPVADHPVTEGLPESFEITDELYLCPVFEEDVVPLLRSDYVYTDDNFYSAAQAVAGQMNSRTGWSHPPGSNLVGWAKTWGNSPIVYLQGGDDCEALGNEYFSALVRNAVRWVASDEARAWARAQA